MIGSIWDINQFAPLEEVSRRHKITFTLRGGVAFRLALMQQRAPLEQQRTIDLFKLVRFTSDIDLIHTGSPDLTTNVLDDILSTVPIAPCFRWELHAEREIRQISANQAHSNFIPARLIEFTSEVPDGLQDPAEGLNDIRTGMFRYYRNPLFRKSSRYKSGQDIEIFSALLYLQTLAEAELSLAQHKNQPGWPSICSVFKDATADPELPRLLQEHAYLRSRLRHLLLATAAAYSERADFLAVAESCDLAQLILELTERARALPLEAALADFFGRRQGPNDLILYESDRLNGDTFRLRLSQENWKHFPADIIRAIQLAEPQILLAISPDITIESGSVKGISDSTGPLAANDFALQEFIYFELPSSQICLQHAPSPMDDVQEELLSAFLILHSHNKWIPLAVPAIVRRQRSTEGTYGRLAITMNCLGMLKEAAANHSAQARVALVAWRAPS